MIGLLAETEVAETETDHQSKGVTSRRWYGGWIQRWPQQTSESQRRELGQHEINLINKKRKHKLSQIRSNHLTTKGLIERNSSSGRSTRRRADKFIALKNPKESQCQTQLLCICFYGTESAMQEECFRLIQLPMSNRVLIL